MENITQPWQVVFLGIVGLGAAVVIGVWFWIGVRGSEPDDAGPVELIRRDWQALLDWRPAPITSSGTKNPEPDRLLHAEQSPATTTPENSNNGVATPQNNNNALLLQTQAATLAALVKAGKVGETDGIRIVFGCAPSSSNPKYLAARTALKTELEKLNNPFPHMTMEQRKRREELGIAKP